jgi:hypothetical protein
MVNVKVGCGLEIGRERGIGDDSERGEIEIVVLKC